MTEHPDDDSWQIEDDELNDSDKTADPDETQEQENDVNGRTHKITASRSSGNLSVQSSGTTSSKSTKPSTRRENEKLRLEIQRLRKRNAVLRSITASSRSPFRKSRNGSSRSREPPQALDNLGDDESHDSSLTSSTRSSTRRENKRLRRENEKIRSELAELKRRFEDREEVVWSLVVQLAKLVQDLQTENDDFRSRLGAILDRIDTNSVVTATTVEPSFWKKYQKEGIFLVLVTGAVVARYYLPVSVRDRLRMAAMVENGVRIVQVAFENGVAYVSEIFMETVPNGARMVRVAFENGVAYISEMVMETVPNGARIAQVAIENSVNCPAGETIANSIEGAITGMLNISQNGVGLAELDY